jgi:hypothetical protein
VAGAEGARIAEGTGQRKGEARWTKVWKAPAKASPKEWQIDMNLNGVSC